MSKPALKRRWFPRVRFSLRTLVFAVLLMGSGATLWWNWGPWAVAFKVQVHGVTRWYSSPKYSAWFIKDPLPGAAVKTKLMLYDLGTGRECFHDFTERIETSETYLIFSKTSRYIFAKFTKGPDLLYDTHTKICIALPHVYSDEPGKCGLLKESYSFASNDALLAESVPNRIFHLPNLEPLPPKNSLTSGALLCENDRWLVGITAHSVFTLRHGEGTPAAEWNLPDEARPSGVFGDTLACPNLSGTRCQLYDACTGALKKEIFTTDTLICGSPKGTHMLASRGNDSPATLWQIEPDIQKIRVMPHKNYSLYHFSGERLLGDSPLCEISPASGETMWEAQGEGHFSSDGRFAYERLNNDHYILDGMTGRILFKLYSINNPGQIQVVFHEDDLTSFSVFQSTEKGYVNCVDVYKLKRSFEWYGLAWLPEFWLTLVFGVALIWSLWRDRRIA